VIKGIICSFWVSIEGNILHNKEIMLDCCAIGKIFKLLVECIVVSTRKFYIEGWGEYFEGGKEEHYRQNLSYTLMKVRTSRM